MFKQRCWIAVLVLVLVLAVVGCDRDDDGLAPGSIAGQTYQLNATTRSGIYQLGSGTLIATFEEGNVYFITDEAGNPIDGGTYGYTPGSDSAIITLLTIGGVATTTCNVTYETETNGTFSLRTVQGTLEVGTAQGAFTKI